MKFLITGDTGFIGLNLTDHLQANGHSTIGVSRKTREDALLWTDLIDSNDVSDAQAWIHLAGKAHDVNGKDEYQSYIVANFELTQSVFSKFLESQEANVFVYFSSVKAIANSVDGILDEENGTGPVGAYGESKRKAEDWLLEQTLPANKRLIIFRPCMVHGPHNKGNLNLLYKLVEKGIPYPLVAFDNKRSFLSIGNLCKIVEETCKQISIPSGAYNLSDDGYLSTNELIGIMEDELNKKIMKLRLSRRVIEIFARVGDVLRLPLNTARLNKLTESYKVSNVKIKNALGWEKMPIDIKEGLRITIRSFTE